MILNVRHHEGDRVRVWDEGMSQYGQFNVVKLELVEDLWDAMQRISIGGIIVHHCETTECKCKGITVGETVASAL